MMCISRVPDAVSVEVLVVATPLLFRATPVATFCPAVKSKKVTVPVVTGAPPTVAVTVALKVTDCPLVGLALISRFNRSGLRTGGGSGKRYRLDRSRDVQSVIGDGCRAGLCAGCSPAKKVRASEQVAPGTSVVEEEQSVPPDAACAKSVVTESADAARLWLPVFETVTVCAVLVRRAAGVVGNA